jgi:16S rRNA (guanine527-N7)-methyltransferase
MQVGSEQWIALLTRGASLMDINLSSIQAIQMAAHAKALLEWNRKINLTAITDPEQVVIKHFLDSIAPMRHIPEQGGLIDIGTGGGFPGLPLKVMRPDQPMIFLDASRKKVNFVKFILRQLGLPNAEAIQARVEEFSQNRGDQGRFTTVISRAFTDIESISHMAGALLSKEGRIIIYQGPKEEIRQVHNPSLIAPLRILHTIDYQFPIIGDRRTLVVVG